MAPFQALEMAILHHLCPSRWRNLREMMAKGNAAEFAGALLSISVQQDFTGGSYRDTLVLH